MAAEQTFRNARIVLPDAIVDGALTIRDGLIAGMDSGSSAIGEDFDGDFLLPGLIELHTDHL
jgi:alpha-D-ribose 1-methylphosphonate 5-triphosphate diphosphatase